MQVSIIALFPEIIEHYIRFGVISRAVESSILTVKTYNPRDFALDKHKSVDARPYGGGPGMVLMPGPLDDAIIEAKKKGPSNTFTIYLTPQGRPFTQDHTSELAQFEHLILICGRYEGIDQRIIDKHVDLEISIGDYVLSGGELAANVLLDATARALPDLLGHPDSFQSDSFSNQLLEHPQYTRPDIWDNRAVPSVLLSGNNSAIKDWHNEQALEKTKLVRPDLLSRNKK